MSTTFDCDPRDTNSGVFSLKLLVRDEDALRHPPAGNGAEERLECLSVDWAVERIALRLHEDKVESERVLLDAAVDAPITTSSEVLCRVVSRAAITHRDEHVEHQLLEERGRLLKNLREQSVFQVVFSAVTAASNRSVGVRVWSVSSTSSDFFFPDVCHASCQPFRLWRSFSVTPGCAARNRRPISVPL
jgi:hypothetical protein